jgi:hypothetical protein
MTATKVAKISNPEFKPVWFLSFYGQNDEAIQKCMDELSDALGMTFLYATCQMLMTVNPFLSEKDKPAVRADICFASQADLEQFKKDPRGLVIYVKYAHPTLRGTVIERHPGDIAFEAK